jgi:acetyl-CoA C-acetyltransferase
VARMEARASSPHGWVHGESGTPHAEHHSEASRHTFSKQAIRRKQMREAVILSTARTGLAKSFRGGFNDTEAPAMGGHVVRAAIARAGIDPAEVDDCIFGAAAQQGTQAYNIGRLCGIAGGLPDTVAGMSIERQCSSGLMSIATAAKSIMCNEYDIAVAGGVESISLVQTKHKNAYRNVSTTVTAIDPTAYMPMLETAEVVSERYNIRREDQDIYSCKASSAPRQHRRRGCSRTRSWP